jgi:hypothetical protein
LAILAHFLSKILCVNHTKLPFVAKWWKFPKKIYDVIDIDK